jgi:hypothetical protein
MQKRGSGGHYDRYRRAFRNSKEMGYFLDVSGVYCFSRLNNEKEFTDFEIYQLDKAVLFFDETEIYPADIKAAIVSSWSKGSTRKALSLEDYYNRVVCVALRGEVCPLSKEMVKVFISQEVKNGK